MFERWEQHDTSPKGFKNEGNSTDERDGVRGDQWKAHVWDTWHIYVYIYSKGDGRLGWREGWYKPSLGATIDGSTQLDTTLEGTKGLEPIYRNKPWGKNERERINRSTEHKLHTLLGTCVLWLDH